jgi:hypothetical protein
MKLNLENIEPRRRLLDVWSAMSDFAFADRTWQWQGRGESNSISDAEQLLCILQPATALPQLRLADPNETSEDAKFALRRFGTESQIPRTIIEVLEEYLSRHTVQDGTPSFAGGSAFLPWTPGEKPTEEQRGLDLLTSFTTSLSLCLSALEFLQDYLETTARGSWRVRSEELQRRLSERLTGALVGLIRGFTTAAVDPVSSEGAALIRLLDQDETGEPQLIIDRFNRLMAPVRGRINELRLGTVVAQELEDPNLPFELGWTWGIASDAPLVAFDDAHTADLPQAPGVALSAPFLYFTLMSLDAIEQLTADRVRVLGLLTPLQDRLASALGQRRDLTQIFWSRLARFQGTTRWPLEDLPWRTLDGTESDYFSLMVTAVLTQEVRQRTASGPDLRRLEPLLTELANRARITRRPVRDDTALVLHEPGERIELNGAEKLGPSVSVQVSDFAPVLFKRCMQMAELTTDASARDRLLGLATQVWNHLSQRRIDGGKAAGLWDDPARVFGGIRDHHEDPLWSMNARVVDALVTSANALNTRQSHNNRVNDVAIGLLSEAEHLLYDQQMSTPALNYSPIQRGLEEIRISLQRARAVINDNPSIALALSINAITQMDKNNEARQNARDGREL